MTTPKPLSVLISGSGVAGASMALTLARQPSCKTKIAITVIERSPVPRTTGQAVDIRGPGVDVIRLLGLEPEIKSRHTSETGLAVVNGQGKVLGKLDATGDAQRQSATSEYEILRGDLAGLLLDGVEKAKNEGADMRIVYDETIQSLENRDEGVDVKFTNGKLEPQRFDVVIAADGISSKTRSLIFGEEDRAEHIKPSGMTLGFFSIPRIAQDDDTWRWCTLPHGLSMHLRPHGNKKTMGVYLCMTEPKPQRNPEIEAIDYRDIAAQKAYLHKKFEGVGWQSDRFLVGLDAADDFYMSHWCRVETPVWAKGRCVILGDAAFATMGIGTSLAMTGAFVIAGELSKIESTDGVSAALQSYERIFRPCVDKVGKPPANMMQLANPQTAFGVGVLHTLIRTVFVLRLPQLMKWFGGGGEKQDWTLPDYGWPQVQTSPAK